MKTLVQIAACGAILLCPILGAAERLVPIPGHALNEKLPEGRLTPVELALPEVPGGAAFGLPVDSVVSVRVRLAVGHDGTVVDAEPAPAALIRVVDHALSAYPGVDLTLDQARSFQETARAGVLDGRFAIDPALRVGPTGFVRAAVSMWWVVSGQAEFHVACMTTAQRASGLVLAEGCADPTVVAVLNRSGVARGSFKLPGKLTDDELNNARGIPTSRLLPTGQSGCGLLAEPPSDVAWTGTPGLVGATLVPGTMVRPANPPVLREWKVSASVLFSAIIGKDGSIIGVVAARPFPAFPELVDGAMNAMCQWRYDPATMGGLPVPTDTSLRFMWKSLD